jgi:O-antigen/teichoic acid export membrane protein
MLESIHGILKKAVSSKFLRASFLVSISKLVSSISNLLFMIFAVNILTRNDNGYLQYYLGYLPVVLAIAEFGLPAALVKYLSTELENKREIGNILSASLWIKLCSFLALCLAGAFFTLVLHQDGLVLFLLIVGGTTTSFLTFFESIFVAFREYRHLAIWAPLGNLIKLLVLYLSYYHWNVNLGYLDILSIFCISPIFILVVFFLLFPKDKILWSGETKATWERFRILSSFNLWAFSASIFAILSDRLEIFLIKKFHNAEQVAIYGTSLQLFSGFQILFSTLNSMILPRLSSLVDEPEEFNRFLKKSFGICAGIAFLLIPGFFLAETILNLLFNNKYSDSIPVFKILYPNYLLQLVFAPLGIALFAMGRPKILAFLAFVRLVIGYILDHLLIPEFGVMGAGVSYFLGQIVSWLILAGFFWATVWR